MTCRRNLLSVISLYNINKCHLRRARTDGLRRKPVRATQSGFSNDRSDDVIEPVPRYDGSLRTLDEDEDDRVTHVYQGRKVISVDSSKSRNYLDKLILIRSCSKTRRNEKSVLLEGTKLINDAIIHGKAEPIAFYSWKLENFSEVLALAVAKTAQFYVIPKRDYLRLSNVGTPQPVVALCRLPSEFPSRETIPLYLICEGVRDPGNLGTLIRTAAAVGCRMVLTLKGTCDPWDPKVIRSAAGSTFIVPIHSYLSWRNMSNFLSPGTVVHLASSDDATCNYDNVGWPVFEHQSSILRNTDDVTDASTEFEPAVAVVVSNEGWGVSDMALEWSEKTNGQQLKVPMCSTVDSLNCSIAGSIILYELRRKFLKIYQI